MKEVKLQLWGEGLRIDVIASDGDIIECHNALREGELFEIQVIDGDGIGEDVIGEISPDILGPLLGMTDDDDPDYEKVAAWRSDCYILDPEELDGDPETIIAFQTKIYGIITIIIPDDETFDPSKVRLLWNEFVLPDSEEPVYFGALYNGVEYPIELDYDTEREISSEEIWSC